jgi:hypothetical protein
VLKCDLIFADEEGVPRGHPQVLVLLGYFLGCVGTPSLSFCPFFNSSHHSPIPTLENFLHTKLNTIITPIFIGSQQTQHAELHNGDVDHIRQLTRSKHEAHGGEDNHLATAMDP